MTVRYQEWVVEVAAILDDQGTRWRDQCRSFNAGFRVSAEDLRFEED